MKLLQTSVLTLFVAAICLGADGQRLAQSILNQKRVPMPLEAIEGTGFLINKETLKSVRLQHPKNLMLPTLEGELSFERLDVREREHTTTWRGVHAETGTKVILTVSDHGLFATYYRGLEKQITVPGEASGAYYTYRLDASKQVPMMGCSAKPQDLVFEDDLEIEAIENKALAECDASVQVDVMVLYTEGLATRLGDNMQGRVQHLIDLTNNAYQNSQVDLELRLVYSAPVSYDDSIDIGDALNAVTNGDDVFAEVEALRTQYGADQVTLLRNLSTGGQFITCGIAWILTTNSIQGGSRSSYAVVDDHFSRCFDLAYAHEVGHNMGLAHDRATQTENQGGGGKYSYSNGHQEPSAQFVTVMGYDFTGVCPCGYVPNYSNPDVTIDGLPTGLPEENAASADNARTLRDTRLLTSRYRSQVKGTNFSQVYYVPEVQLQDGLNTQTTLVNSGVSTATVDVYAFSARGDLLAKLMSVTQLLASQRVKIDVNESFPDMSEQIAWIQVGSNMPIEVFAEIQSSTVRSAYWASQGLTSELYVPHVAKNIAQFETIISTVNGAGLDAAVEIIPEPFGSSYDFTDLECGYAQTSGNAVDYFGSDLIEIVDWATIISATGASAAMEFFSYLPDRSRVASLGLSDQRGSHLRFLHVAADVSQFWTGLVYINTGNSSAQVSETYYDGSGNVLKNESLSLIRGQKRTLLFDQANTEPVGTVWVDVQTSSPNLVGYELFGSATGSPHDFFAGLQGNLSEGRSLTYPHVQSTNGAWTGLVALNVGGEVADITFEAMNDSGAVVESVTISAIAPNVKFAQTSDGLFSAGTLSQATWVRASSTASQWAGFLLWGDLGEVRNHLSGIVASVQP